LSRHDKAVASHRQPSESVIPPFDLNREAVVLVRLNHSGDRGIELVAAVPGGEQVNVLAGSLEKSSRLNRIAARESEPILPGGG
jgi:hypothetical protein